MTFKAISIKQRSQLISNTLIVIGYQFFFFYDNQMLVAIFP